MDNTMPDDASRLWAIKQEKADELSARRAQVVQASNATSTIQTASSVVSTPATAGPSRPFPTISKNEGKSPTPSRYTPQFTASTKQILSRIKNENGIGSSSPSLGFTTAQLSAPAKATYEDVKRRLVETLSTSATLPMPTASPRPTAADVTHANQLPSPSVGKRKRGSDEHDGRPPTRPTPRDEPQPVAIQPPKPPAKRKRVKDSSMCVKCQRSSDTAANLIITCGCGEAWHQLCHDPQVSEETASNPASFKCSTCVVEDKAQANYQAKLVKYREAKQQQSDLKRQRAEVERMRTRNLEGLPDFIKPELVGFGAGDASTDARREYFEELRRTDLLNLLSFSEQIKPGLLVDILVSVSKKQPDLPIFRSPDWAQPRAKQPESSRTNVLANGTGNHLPPKRSKQRSKPGGVRPILQLTTAPEADAVPEDNEDDYLHPNWPKAGKGLYATLPPEKEDSHYLEDDNDEEAFSHFFSHQMDVDDGDEGSASSKTKGKGKAVARVMVQKPAPKPAQKLGTSTSSNKAKLKGESAPAGSATEPIELDNGEGSSKTKGKGKAVSNVPVVELDIDNGEGSSKGKSKIPRYTGGGATTKTAKPRAKSTIKGGKANKGPNKTATTKTTAATTTEATRTAAVVVPPAQPQRRGRSTRTSLSAAADAELYANHPEARKLASWF
ncbi:SWM histone demethylase complex subunit phf1 [Colletotrichum tropicale]|nr:SWM histone demethylase complex subunit phf1 [Colletotrichum tropicale]